MKSFALLVLFAGVAGASERYPLYPEHHVPEESALRRVDEVVASCAVDWMSRLGPSRENVALCNAAEARLLSMGKTAVPAVLQRLDTGPSLAGVDARLYDVLARVGDASLVEPLVSALERQDAEVVDEASRAEPVNLNMAEIPPTLRRELTRTHIVRTLERVTHQKVSGSPASAWRQWASAHGTGSKQSADGKPAS